MIWCYTLLSLCIFYFQIWIFGMVERETNCIILYPVSDRTEATLLPIIQRHVAPGSTIYSDGWASYCNLNDVGYKHFTVLHKYAFKKVFVHTVTKEEVVVHTNRIEGAWKHAKQHFKKMSGTKLTQFEGHLAEIMWRSRVKGRVYQEFFGLLSMVYPLHEPATYQYTTPLFDSWAIERVGDPRVAKTWKIKPGKPTHKLLKYIYFLKHVGEINTKYYIFLTMHVYAQDIVHIAKV
jgi:transposase-like protein